MNEHPIVEAALLPALADQLRSKPEWGSLVPSALYGVSPAKLLVLGRVLFPQFLNIRECAVVPWRYDPANFEIWWSKLEGNRAAVESILNHTHVFDLLAGTDEPLLDDDAVCIAIGELLTQSWSAALAGQFPTRRYEVTLSTTPEDYGPTVYVERRAPLN